MSTYSSMTKATPTRPATRQNSKSLFGELVVVQLRSEVAELKARAKADRRAYKKELKASRMAQPVKLKKKSSNSIFF